MRQTHKEEHGRLWAMIDAYLEMLRSGVAPDIALVMKRRLAFSNAYLAHVASEGPVFNRLRTGDPDHPTDRLLNEYGGRLRDIMPGYSALIQQWTPQRIVDEWPAYCRQVQDQVAHYQAFLAWEEANIHPLLDKADELRRAS
ncbi:MAG: hypothetical protein J7498_04065 [Sphingobium sp.]|nr:hypothetical protein [Sphingobium sp.]